MSSTNIPCSGAFAEVAIAMNGFRPPRVQCPACKRTFAVAPNFTAGSPIGKHCTSRLPPLVMGNRWEVRGDITALFVKCQPGGAVRESLIDTSALPFLLSARATWTAYTEVTGMAYVIASGRAFGLRGAARLHRALMGFPDKPCDHIDGDTLNNRRENLRVVADSVNGLNRHVVNGKSGIRCVTKVKNRPGWASVVCGIHVGYFRDIRDAAECVYRALMVVDPVSATSYLRSLPSRPTPDQLALHEDGRRRISDKRIGQPGVPSHVE